VDHHSHSLVLLLRQWVLGRQQRRELLLLLQWRREQQLRLWLQ